MRPTIVWDWNGTLLNDVKAAVSALNQMLSFRDLAPISLEFYQANFGFPVRPFYKKCGMNPDLEWDRLCHEFHRFVRKQKAPLRSDALAAVQYVKEKGYIQSVVSALQQDLLFFDVCAAKLGDYMSGLYGAYNLEGTSKLARARECVSQFSSDVCVYFIGDTLHDVEVARTVGAQIILVEGGHQATSRLLKAKVPVVPSLMDAVHLALD